MVTGTGGDGDKGVSGGKESIPEFVGQAGCAQDMSNKSPMEFFQLFITAGGDREADKPICSAVLGQP